MARFGTPVTRLSTLSSYDCRNRIGSSLSRVSEHAFANAIDIAALTTSDGRKIEILSQWGLTARDLRTQAAPAASAGSVAAGSSVAATGSTEAHVAPVVTPDDSPKKIGRKRGSKNADVSAEVPKAASASGTSGTVPPSDEVGTAAVQSRSQKGQLPPATSLGGPKPGPPLTVEARFLRDIHKGACGVFGTALSPEANEAHRNHLHLDLAPRRNSAFCE